MIYILLFSAMFTFVFLKAIQQQNVVFKNYWLVVPTSVGMAYTEVYVVAEVVTRYLSAGELNHGLLWSVGLGGGIGCVLAMKLHQPISTFLQPKSKVRFKNSWKVD